MEETMHQARNGWSEEETALLWREIREAAETGAPLRGVFERMGQALGRKPNSVRNYYYMQLRDQAGEEMRRAAPFETFTEEEVHDLLRKVLMAQGKGQSVRACVMELSGGDKSRMLRYQNKYRSVLRKKPEMIQCVCQELCQENLPYPAALPRVATRGTTLPTLAQMEVGQDQDAQAILRAVSNLVARAQTNTAENDVAAHDRLKVQRDLLLMQLEDIQLAAKELIRVCKEFLGTSDDVKAQRLNPFCAALSEKMAKLESLAG